MRPMRIISAPGSTQRKTALVPPQPNSRQRSACVRALREPGLILGRSVRSYWMIPARLRHLNMPLLRIRTMQLHNTGLAPSTCIKRKPGLRSTTFRRAYELNPSDQSTLNALQMALRQSGDLDGADHLKQQLAELLRDRDRNNQNKLKAVQINNEGTALEKSGDLRGALARYRDAAQLDPSHAGIRTNYGVALLRMGNWSEGLEELHQALQLDPHNEQIRAALKDALSQAPDGTLPESGWDGFRHRSDPCGVCSIQGLRIEFRRACPELVERGRLKVIQDFVPSHFQPSLTGLELRINPTQDCVLG